MKSILVVILFFVGAVFAAPTEVDDRVEYTTSLNSMASIVMNWYGSLIKTNQPVSFTATEQQWDKYRAQYPNNITQIQIKNTDLTKMDGSDKYQFNVNTYISYNDSAGEYGELVSETFIFQVATLAKPIIKKITRDKTEQTTAVDTTEFNRSYYKAREFAYAWLAYLDGVKDMQKTIDAEQWLAKANYSMEIGGGEVTGAIASTLATRQQYLTKGGHLLHSLDVMPIAGKANSFMLDLILEWKGVNQTGKPVLAKIHQQIEYKILDNNAWQVQSIKEQHLLPDIAPWIGLLC